MDDVAGIILAGGYSSRAGDFKMTHKILGLPVVEYVIRSMYGVCGSITVVTGFQAEKLEYLKRKYSKVQTVWNQTYNGGMFSSVLTGLTGKTEGKVFITPGDCPAVRAETFAEMEQFQNFQILLPCFHGKTGHPVLINGKVGKKNNRGAFSNPP